MGESDDVRKREKRGVFVQKKEKLKSHEECEEMREMKRMKKKKKQMGKIKRWETTFSLGLTSKLHVVQSKKKSQDCPNQAQSRQRPPNEQ